MLDWSFAIAVDVAKHPAEAEHHTVTRVREALSKPPWPDVEFWGQTEQAQRAARAMADLAGGPAPMRTE